MKTSIIKNLMFIVTSIIIFSLLCHSCVYVPHIPTTASHRGPIDDNTIASLKAGVTTREDVLLRFGCPTLCSEDEKLFKYCWRIARGALIIAFFTYFDVKPIMSIDCLSVEFDEQGIIKKHQMEVPVTNERWQPECR